MVDPVPIKSPPRPARTWLGRLSVGHVVTLAAGVLAILVNFLLLQAADDRIPVAVAGEDLQVGQPIEYDSLLVTQVRVDPSIEEQLLRHDRLADYGPLVAVRPIAAGELLTTSHVGAPAASHDRRAMSIPVEESHAVGGSLQRGDVVDVIVVAGGSARFIATGLEVLEVPSSQSGAIGGSRAFFVTVAVEPDEALALASVIRQGDFELVRATGAELVEAFPVEAATAGEDE